MAFGGVDDYIEPDRVTRTFVRVRRGYDPPAVDAHLAVVREGVEQLLRRLDRDDSDSLDLVFQATKKSIDEALESAHARADTIMAAAQDTATSRLREAQLEAERIVCDAKDRARTNDEAARERYVELGRLLDIRRTELEGLDQQIAARQQVLRRAAQELRTLADGMPPQHNGGSTRPEPELTVPDGVELHFPEQVPTEA